MTDLGLRPIRKETPRRLVEVYGANLLLHQRVAMLLSVTERSCAIGFSVACRRVFAVLFCAKHLAYAAVRHLYYNHSAEIATYGCAVDGIACHFIRGFGLRLT